MALLDRVENMLLNEPGEAGPLAKAVIEEVMRGFKTWLEEGFLGSHQEARCNAVNARRLANDYLEEELGHRSSWRKELKHERAES